MAKSEHHPYKNVAVPENEHALLARIAEHEDRAMSRQLAVMIREKYRALGLDVAADPAPSRQAR